MPMNAASICGRKIVRAAIVLMAGYVLMAWGMPEEAPRAYAATFQWTDEHGTAVFTDNILTVPRPHRKHLVQRQVRQPVRSIAVRPPDDDGDAPRETDAADAIAAEGTSGERTSEAIRSDASREEPFQERDRWRARLRTAKTTLAERRAERRALEKTLHETQYGMWLTFGPGASDRDQREAIPEIERKLRDVETEIRQREQEVKFVIPGEARRAGIPPGWLR